jgi:hypothetical protein
MTAADIEVMATVVTGFSSLAHWPQADNKHPGSCPGRCLAVAVGMSSLVFWVGTEADVEHLTCFIRISSVAAVGFAMETSNSGIEVEVHMDVTENAVTGTRMVAT